MSRNVHKKYRVLRATFPCKNVADVRRVLVRCAYSTHEDPCTLPNVSIGSKYTDFTANKKVNLTL